MTVAITPTDAGPLGAEYTFILCNEADCDIMTNPFCKVANDSFPSPDSTVCSTSTYVGSPPSLDYAPGDTLSIQAYKSEAAVRPIPSTSIGRWTMRSHLRDAF